MKRFLSSYTPRLFGAVLLSCAAAFAARAQPLPKASTTPHYNLNVNLDPDIMNGPIGYREFCGRDPNNCTIDNGHFRQSTFILTRERWEVLNRVNTYRNVRIKPRTDMDKHGLIEKWELLAENDLEGDCEEYVLAKLHDLVKIHGWPRSALAIIVARQKNGQAHAVLAVKTNRGTYILDNMDPQIKLWSQTDYKLAYAQDWLEPKLWRHIDYPPVIAVKWQKGRYVLDRPVGHILMMPADHGLRGDIRPK